MQLEPARGGRRFLRHIALAAEDCENARPSGLISARTLSSRPSTIRLTSAAANVRSGYSMSRAEAVSVKAGTTRSAAFACAVSSRSSRLSSASGGAHSRACMPPVSRTFVAPRPIVT
jgi:hypothetical protein